MKILFLSDDFPPLIKGGAGLAAFRLARGLKKKGHQVFVITTSRQGPSVRERIYQGLKIFTLQADYSECWRAYLSLANPQTVGRVKKIIHQIKPSVVHAHNLHYYLSYQCLKVAKKYSPVFLTAHDVMLFHYGKLIPKGISPRTKIDQPFNYQVTTWDLIKYAQKRYNPFRNLIIRYYLRYVDKIFAVSRALKQVLNNQGIKNVEVIYNGIDVRDWQINPAPVADFKKKYRLENKKVVFFGGRLSGAKGGEKIILTMEQVIKQVPQAVLLVAGHKKGYAQKMIELANQLKIENQIIFAGWLDENELKLAYHSSDLCLTPSLYLDPFPLFNIEAMAAQKPVIGTCFGGTPEIVLDGVTGYIVNPLNIEMMADKIIDCLTHPAKAQRFGQAGYQRVKRYFSLQKQVKETLKWYHRYPKNYE